MTGIEKELFLIRKHLQSQETLSVKIADNLLAIGNLALAGIVFTQFIPNSTLDRFYVLFGIIVFSIMYGTAVIMLRRK